MQNRNTAAAFFLGVCVAIGLAALGYLLAEGALRVKALDRTVTVKGLAEREVEADIAIWPITYSIAANTLSEVYAQVERNNQLVKEFLLEGGFSVDEISFAAPSMTDRKAQAYGDTVGIEFRYTGSSSVTVYTTKVELVRRSLQRMAELGKQGVAISAQEYGGGTQFLFTGLNAIKPAMIEEATRAAREVAEKFARDSSSRLGRIRNASQGQFSIENRDMSTPYIKKVRVVSTVEYYLTD